MERDRGGYGSEGRERERERRAEGETGRRLIGGWCGGRSDGEGGGERARRTRAARVARGIVARGERAERARSTRRERGEESRERGRGREGERERETRPRLARFWMGEGVSGGWSRGRVAGNGEVGRVSLSLVSPGHHPVSLSRRRFLSLRCVFRGKRPSLVDGPSHGLQLSPNPSTPLLSAPLHSTPLHSVRPSVGRSVGRSVDRSFRPSFSLPPPSSLFPPITPRSPLPFLPVLSSPPCSVLPAWWVRSLAASHPAHPTRGEKENERERGSGGRKRRIREGRIDDGRGWVAMVVEAAAAVVVVVVVGEKREEGRRWKRVGRAAAASENAILLRPYVLDTRRPSDGAKPKRGGGRRGKAGRRREERTRKVTTPR